MPAFALAKPITPILQPGYSPAGAWPLCDGGGLKIRDASGNGNDGTLNGGVTWADGPWGKCLSFNGVDGYVSTPGLANIGKAGSQQSLSCRISTAVDITTYRGIFGAYNGGATSFPLNFLISDVVNNKVGLEMYDGAANNPTCVSLTTLNDGLWHHLVGIRNGGSMSLYVDGVFNSSTTFTDANFSTPNPVQLGRYFNNAARYFPGQLDSPKIYPYALSPAQIAADYADSFAYCRPRRRLVKAATILTTAFPYALASQRVDQPNDLSSQWWDYYTRRPNKPIVPLSPYYISWQGTTNLSLNWLGVSNTTISWQGSTNQQIQW